MIIGFEIKMLWRLQRKAQHFVTEQHRYFA